MDYAASKKVIDYFVPIFRLREMDRLVDFPIFCGHGRQLVILPVCFYAHQSFSEKGSNLSGKNLLPRGANSYRLELSPFSERD